MKKIYSKPLATQSISKLRATILAGSGDTSAFNGVRGGSTLGKDFEFDARQRSISTID